MPWYFLLPWYLPVQLLCPLPQDTPVEHSLLQRESGLCAECGAGGGRAEEWKPERVKDPLPCLLSTQYPCPAMCSLRGRPWFLVWLLPKEGLSSKNGWTRSTWWIPCPTGLLALIVKGLSFVRIAKNFFKVLKLLKSTFNSIFNRIVHSVLFLTRYLSCMVF